MKQTTRILIFMLVMLLGVASCGDEPDGKWEKMKWNDLSGLTKEEGVYIVPIEGGTYTFECKNYKPWIDYCDCGSSEQAVCPSNHVIGEWFEVNCDNNIVTVTIQPLEGSTAPRHLVVTLTAGDIFDQFRFIQRP